VRKLNRYIETLRKRGLRITAQRIEILKLVTERRDHPSVEDVYNHVKTKFPTISPATVYKTLQILKEAGMIQELAFYDGKTRVDANMKPHINLICTRCGTITDLYHEKVDELLTHVAERTHFNIQGQRIDLYGICRDCQQQR